MSIEKYKIPTGYLFVDDYEKGKLETLSIGDYGKKANVKADFLGYTDEINGVSNKAIIPLSEKWVITLSTQYGCPMDCTFCACPSIDFKGNATINDLYAQLYNAILMFPNIKYTERLNIHFARIGEPLLNFSNIYKFTYDLYKYKDNLRSKVGLRVETLHPVLTTCWPKFVSSFYDPEKCLASWIHLKNKIYNGQAGLQLSINSTNENQRLEMFGDKVETLENISIICKKFPMSIGRKYCLNFAYANSFEVDALRLRRMFDPEKFMVKITPIHKNEQCKAHKLETINGYDSYDSYRNIENSLKEVGFDVLVFIPSDDEENGLVTCGNAILGGGKLNV
jgi:23S rRNA (adenine2503-C2)-methyltransferase